MKKLGLIGGVGPEATLQYYREIEYGVMERLGSPVLPSITIESLSCFRMIPYGAAQDYDGMTDYVLGAVRTLEKADCALIAMACCTGHMVFDRVQAQTAVPMLSLVQACADEALERGHRRLLLLGTEGTMKDGYFKHPFEKAGMQVVVPSPAEQTWVGQRIELELEHGSVSEQTRAEFLRIAEETARRENADAVILGCTELPMVFHDAALAVPVLDATAIHIRRIIDAIL